ncbi:MAG: hypothetical protein V4739_19060, partial [Pseudomonadota bacterium]
PGQDLPAARQRIAASRTGLESALCAVHGTSLRELAHLVFFTIGSTALAGAGHRALVVLCGVTCKKHG